ncbi:hypothetical protein M5689_007002 [Euphorbia peplus]|nr:hypothetical protein M5689_007002 [Euphorbia peplus]
MGACLSKKKGSSSSSLPSSLNVSVAPKKFLDSETPLKGELQIKKKVVAVDEEEKEKEKKKQVAAEEDNNFVKKEIFVIKHRKSHDRERPERPSSGPVPPKQEDELKISSGGENCSSVVRTSSCTKEEVDAILIQCGRLSRSNSSGTVAAKAASSGRKYAGSKRSYDLDHDQDELAAAVSSSSADYEARKRDEEEEDGEDRRQHRQRHRQSGRRTHSSPSQGRRRTPSRERDQEQRSGSRERGNGSSTSGGRRVSRSPGRRSETTPTPNSNGTTNSTTRPGKMVSVPATVSSLAIDKSNNGVESQMASGVKRISVKRNAGEAAGSRTAASPRSKSPARGNARGGSNENNQQQQPSLSRSNSRKAEHSPYRRNPLSEIDPNSLVYAPTTTGNNKNTNGTGRVQTKTREAEVQAAVKEVVNQKPNAQGANKIVKEQIVVAEEAKAMPQTLTRTRSARRSRDFDFNPATLVNPNPSYTSLLLEDIHNFHQKTTNSTPNAPAFSVPACVTKACSIVEAVADLNSTTSSNLSCGFAEDKRVPKKVALDVKDPFVESEVVVSDDLMEPSLHKYVTVRRGGNGTEDMDGQESSGSNSFVGVAGSHNNHWGYSTSSWEPNSADSTDRWTSRSNTREDGERSPLGFQQHVIFETGLDMEEARRGFSAQRTGIGRRFNPIVAAAST